MGKEVTLGNSVMYIELPPKYNEAEISMALSVLLLCKIQQYKMVVIFMNRKKPSQIIYLIST